MEKLNILLTLDGDEALKCEKALKVKQILEKRGTDVRIITIPYSTQTRNANYDSVLVWSFINLETDPFIALDLLAGTISSRNGCVWLVGKDDLSMYNSSIQAVDWKNIRQKIIRKCMQKKIIADTQEVADFYKELLGKDIEVRRLPDEGKNWNEILDLLATVEE